MAYRVTLENDHTLIKAEISIYAYRGDPPKQYDVVAKSQRWSKGYYRAIVTDKNIDALKRRLSSISWIHIEFRYLTNDGLSDNNFQIEGNWFYYHPGDFKDSLDKRNWPVGTVDDDSSSCSVS